MAIINYQNLPSTATPLNASNLNEMQLNTYSNNETRIGTWRNNKPIYRKIVTFTPSSSAMESSHSHGISNVDEFLPTCSCVLYRSNGATIPFSMVYPSANTTNGITQWSMGWQLGTNITTWVGDNLRGQIDTSRGYGALAILEYTKTTD